MPGARVALLFGINNQGCNSMSAEPKIHDLQTVIKRLLKTYPDFYQPIVKDAEDWIMEDGHMLVVLLFMSLGSVIRNKTIALELDRFEEVFALMEEFAASGDEALSTAVCTGFLESVFNYGDGYDPKFLACLLGRDSRAYMKEWERFNGFDPSWLDVK